LTDLLSRHFAEVQDAVRRARHILLLLDFDGTLTPIVARPELAVLPEEVRGLLRDLHAQQQVQVAVISGRALADLQQRVGLDVIYAGNHGLEIEGQGLHFQGPDLAHSTTALQSVITELLDQLGPIAGALLENKGATLSIHYRSVEESRVPEVVRMVEATCATHADVLEVHHGKMVLEVRPRVQWNKGEAARWILEQVGPADTLVISMGDDRTDEDIFKALPGSISIKVGDGATAARYRVANPAEVQDVLARLVALARHSVLH
jgi:trehalose-phosphatase